MTIQPGPRTEITAHLRAVPGGGTVMSSGRQFMPPRFPSDLVGLDGQRRWLDRLADREACVVQAPAGYGKSAWCAALFAEARAAGWRAAWLAIDTDDDAAAAPQLCRIFGLAQDEETSAADIADALAERMDAADAPLLLVVDNADRLVNARARSIFERLMRHPPTQLRLLLASRARPGIALDDVAARGMLLAIGRRELGLSDGDAQRFLVEAGASLGARDVAALNRFVEGWPAALRLLARQPDRLAAMVSAGRWDALAHCLGPLIDPLVDDLPPPAGQLLRRCAVAPRLDPDLCRLLGGDGDSAAMLRDLDARGLFLEPVGDRGYRLHRAARAAMAHRLGTDEAVQLRRVAGRHYASRAMAREAVDQMLACGDFAEAATIVADIAMAMIERGDAARLLDWIDRLPPEIVADSPELVRASHWLAVIEAGDLPQPAADLGPEAPVLSLLHRAFGGDRPDEVIEACDRILADPTGLPDFAVNMVRATLALGALRRGLFGLVHDAVRPLMQRAAGQTLDLPGALAVVAKAGVSRAQGQLGEAERLLREARARLPGTGLVSALIGASLARSCYERDAFEDAADLAAGALPHLERSAFQDALVHAFLVAIRVAAGAGLDDAAAALIDRAELIAFARGWAPLKALCVVERARLRLPQTIDAEAVVAIGDEEGAALDPLSAPARAFAILSEMRAYEAIANGDRPRLTTVAERLLRLASNGDDAELRATATLFNILPQLSGRCDKMVELETVRFLNHAASSGFRRTIVDVLDVTGVRAVQNFCSEAYTSDCFLALLKLAEPSRGNPVLEGGYRAAPGEAFSFLTEREIEILSALKAGESNKEIARTLHLAPETVKWHLKNVMRKLRAGSREEAVANAATLGLKLIEDQRMPQGHFAPK
ncbi:MAG: hypothetical protein JHC57_17135 [Sphingopyxis sp.]|uniref:LuxR C-terminal-related transcriptional regulator n=1 Tax=Sphingopyxis sp. TaxID=1908224 RepID=UPI001A30A899|nr:LuxR C-terminal-related transcriptional regulator [Sphingopyxis sp.]MBJ7501484.1 hypothetical protein [Sphingopyxis sp.]